MTVASPRPQRLLQLTADRRGATIVEFAIVAPVMCLFMVGAFDLAHALYMRASLQGIIQKTGRDSSPVALPFSSHVG